MNPEIMVDVDRNREIAIVCIGCGWKKQFHDDQVYLCVITEAAAEHLLEHERSQP